MRGVQGVQGVGGKSNGWTQHAVQGAQETALRPSFFSGATPYRGPSLGDPNKAPVYHIPQWATWRDPKRLAYMRDLAESAGADPKLRWFVVNEVLRPAGVEPRDYEGQQKAILAWIQQNIYYTNEPGEQLQAPHRTIQVRTGDCDDAALLGAAMSESLNLPWQFVLIGRGIRGRVVQFWEKCGKPIPPGTRFAHIYLALGDRPFEPKKWRVAEPTVKGAPLGRDVALELATGRRGGGSLPGLPELGDVGSAEGWRAWVPTPKELIKALIQTALVTLAVRYLLSEQPMERRPHAISRN